MAYPQSYFPDKVSEVVGDERLKKTSLFKYITSRQINNVSSVDRRMQLKLVINELFDVDYWDIHPRLQMKYYWHLDQILNCTNEKAMFIIDFIEKMINDAFFFTTVKTMGISHLLVCLRRAFVKRGDLEPMPENSGEFAVNEDLYNHLLEWFDGVFDG